MAETEVIQYGCKDGCSEKIEGIVYHVLKEQIEYDFELGRLEESFE